MVVANLYVVCVYGCTYVQKSWLEVGKVSSFLGLAFQDSGPAVRSRISPPAAVGRLLRVSHLSHGPCHALSHWSPKIGSGGCKARDATRWVLSPSTFFSRASSLYKKSICLTLLFETSSSRVQQCPVLPLFCWVSCLILFLITFISLSYTSLRVVYFLTFLPAPCG